MSRAPVTPEVGSGPTELEGTPFPPEADLTGQERLAWNVFAGWAGYLVIAAAGLLAPRIMDRRLGPESLGVWDFGWSLVSYFALTQLGVGSSVQRYVAKYRAAGDVAGLRRMASSVTGLNLVAASLTMALTAVCAWMLPRLLRAELVAELGSARWLVVLLGTSVAAQLALQVYQGVLAGCHRFDILNVVTASFEVLTSLAIVAVLTAGGGLLALGIVCLVFQIGSDLTKMALAHHACPELRVRLADAHWGEAKRLLRYGIKTTVYSISGLLLVQTNKLIVGAAFGLVALAVFSRPLALIRMIETFGTKFAYVLTPTASSLQSSGQHERLVQLLLQAGRLGTALALPMILVLAVLGDPIMLLWMGERYQPGLSIVILSLGYLGAVALAPVTTILFGMNLHGWPALVALLCAAASALLGLLNAWALHGGITGAALAVALPLSVSQAFLVVHACRALGLPVSAFLRHALLAPVACVLPFAVILAASRLLLNDQPLLAIVTGVALGGATVPFLYWRFVVPLSLKAQVGDLPGRLRGALVRSRER